MLPKLDKTNGKIAGVCSGLGNAFKIDPMLIRLAFVLAFLFFGVGPFVYLILWILMPSE